MSTTTTQATARIGIEGWTQRIADTLHTKTNLHSAPHCRRYAEIVMADFADVLIDLALDGFDIVDVIELAGRADDLAHAANTVADTFTIDPTGDNQ